MKSYHRNYVTFPLKSVFLLKVLISKLYWLLHIQSFLLKLNSYSGWGLEGKTKDSQNVIVLVTYWLISIVLTLITLSCAICWPGRSFWLWDCQSLAADDCRSALQQGCCERRSSYGTLYRKACGPNLALIRAQRSACSLVVQLEWRVPLVRPVTS